ncbi:ATP-dependent DNA helicase [Corynebacterium alimapuense]|uniref:ATP-dependent helicase DinG n=1 Tax=Corynebacterium alimapuense TaxID=1576874 RepID=A0A3M8K906_9CORY|nr:ATP-dependent DNA helicase [Corynebacterium alimapuense]RNE49701.1 ATP-dependent helicase [Corynebacterium alimapuense]
MTDSQPLAQSTPELLEAAVAALGGSRRDGQVRMAEAVTHALDSERHLAVQAGTGTGKSLAYLVPAIRHAQAAGTTVIISTATIALQRQLVDRDLPRLVDALAPLMERRPTFAIMKGRSNYVCLNRIGAAEEPENSLLDEEDLSWLGRHIVRVNDWAQETETGDRDDLTPGVPDRAWQQVSVTARECLGATRCPHGEECFAELARRAAHDVDIVVTNHALLAIDALADMDILPEHDVVIIDEAHELDGRITSVATNELSPTTLRLAAKRAGKLGADGRETKLDEIIDAWVTTAATLDSGRWTDLDDDARGPLKGLRDGLWSLREAIAPAPEGEGANDPEKAAERQNLSNHLQELHDAVVRILEVFDEADPAAQQDVVWLERDDRRGEVLTVAPLSVAGLLHERLFAEQTVVLTSATLTIGGQFDAMAAAWGLPKDSWDSLDAGTPFDTRKSGILYTARHLPDPGRDGLAPETLDEIYELIMAAGGRTLGLFSSRRAAQQATEAMRARLPFDVLSQGEDTTGALVDAFAKNENACLFGTLTLWQGVDVPGKSCSLVLIDRVPFPRPDDPLLQARKEAATAAGRNGFMEVAASHAALLLAQGAGRLLRSVTDRGVVAVLDNRLVTKRYGSFLRASMPAFWETNDPQVVRGALARLATGD